MGHLARKQTVAAVIFILNKQGHSLITEAKVHLLDSIGRTKKILVKTILNILFVGDATPTPDFQDDNNDSDELFDPEEELRIDYLFQEFLESYLAFENQTALYKMGHKYEDFVFDCNFRGIDCRYVID